MATKKTSKKPAKRTQYLTLVTFDNHWGDRGSYHKGPFTSKRAARKAAAEELTTILADWDCLAKKGVIDYESLDQHPFNDSKTVAEAKEHIISSSEDEFDFVTVRDDWCEARVTIL